MLSIYCSISTFLYHLNLLIDYTLDISSLSRCQLYRGEPIVLSGFTNYLPFLLIKTSFPRGDQKYEFYSIRLARMFDLPASMKKRRTSRKLMVLLPARKYQSFCCFSESGIGSIYHAEETHVHITKTSILLVFGRTK